MANTTEKDYQGISGDNITSLSIEKNTAYILNVKGTSGATIAANALTYTVDGDNAVVSYDNEYSISLKLSGTITDGYGTTDIPEGIYTFNLEHEDADDSKWVTRFTDSEEHEHVIKLQVADIAKTDAAVPLEQGGGTIIGDFTTLNIANIVNGQAVAGYTATYRAAVAGKSVAQFNDYNEDLAATEACLELTLVDYAKAPVDGSTVKMNGAHNIDDDALFVVDHEGDEYVGSRFAEHVIGTNADEDFDLATSGANAHDQITVKGYFGNDTVAVEKGEKIDLFIKKGDGTNNAEYTATETAEGLLLSTSVRYKMTVDSYATATATTGATELTFRLAETSEGVFQWVSENGAYTIDNVAATFKATDGIFDALAGSNTAVQVNGFESTLYLRNAKIYTPGGLEVDGAVYTAIEGAATPAALSTSFETNIYNNEAEGSILVVGYTTADTALDAAALTVNTTDINASTITKVEPVAGIYAGSWLNESLTSTSANETFALKTGNDVIAFNGNFGNDTVFTVNNENLALSINNGADLSKEAQTGLYNIVTNGSDLTISTSVNYSATVTVKTAGTYQGKAYAADEVINLKLVTTDGGQYVWEDTTAGVEPGKHIQISSDNYTTLLAGDLAIGTDTLKLTQESIKVYQSINGADPVRVDDVAIYGYTAIVAGSTYNDINKRLLGYQGSGQITLKDYAQATATLPAVVPTVTINGGAELASGTAPYETFRADNITSDYSGSRLNETVTVKAGTTSALTVDLGNGTNSFTGQDGNTTVFAGTGANTIVTGAGADTVTVAGGGANEITTGAGNDIINIGDAKAANNTINAGTGNDTIYTSKSTGAGVNTINIYVGDGNETLYSGVESDGKDKIAFQKDSAVAGASTLLTYTKKGEDLVISRDGLITGPGTKINDSVTIKGYLGEEKGHNIALGLQTADPDTTVDAAIATIEFENDVKSGVIKGSWAKDAITATGDAVVTANGGIDKVTLAKDSTNTVIYNVGDAPEGEKLTLSAAKATNIQFNAPEAVAGRVYGAVYTFAEVIAEHKLTITRTYLQRVGAGNWEAARDKTEALIANDKIEITDYLTNGENSVYISDSLALPANAIGSNAEYTPYYGEPLELVATINVASPDADFNGSFLSEVIAAPSAAVKIATGAGNDVVNSSNNVEQVTLGAGNKTFNYDTTAGGKDTIELTKDVDKLVIDVTNFVGDANRTVEYLKEHLRFTEDLTDTSKDLVISDDANGATHNITVKDYFKNGTSKVVFKGRVLGEDGITYEDTEIALEDVVTAANNAAVNLVAKSATEGATFEGSLLAETVNGTNKADVISTGAGDDVITGAEGDDILAGGEGANVFRFTTNSGNDTVYMSGEGEKLEIVAPAGPYDGYAFDMSKEDTYSVTSEFSEDKKDVIITVTAKGTKAEETKIFTDTITLKNYMDGASQGTLVSYKEWNELTNTYDLVEGDITKLVDTASLIEEKGNKVTGTDLADNLVFDDNKSRTIYGLAGNDNIVVEGGKNTIYAGAGDDKIYSGAGADTIDGGEGNNMLYFAEGDGKDVVVDGAGNDILNVTVADPDSVKTAVKGKDLVISYGESGDTITVKGYMTAVMADENHSVSRLNVYNAETGILVNTMNLTAEAAIEGLGGDARVFTVEAADTSKAANLKGSTLSEAIFGTEGNNTIKGGGGNDVIYSAAGSNKVMTESRAVDVKKGVLVADEVKVYAGLGTDTITAGKGNDTYVFSEGKLNGTINANTVGTVTLDMSAFNAGQLDYTVVGKDLVISNTFDPYAGTPAIAGRVETTEKLVIKNYANNKLTDNIGINDGSGVMNLADYLAQVQAANEENGLVLGNSKTAKAQKVNGSFLNETLLGGAGKDTISTGAGVDMVIAGAGNDKITGYIAKEGKNLNYADIDNAKAFVFDYDYDKDSDVAVGSGNDTIVNAKVADTIVFRLKDNNIKDSAAELADNLTLAQKGKNLIIGYNQTVDAKGKVVYTDSITVNNYFGKNVESVKGITITDSEGRNVAAFTMNDFENGVLKADVKTAIKTAANTAQGYVANEAVYTVDNDGDLAFVSGVNTQLGNTSYKAVACTGAYNLEDVSGNDVYDMTLLGANDKVTIIDHQGVDALVVTTSKTGFALFDVKADGTAANTSMFIGDSANMDLDHALTLQGQMQNVLANGDNKTIKVQDQFVVGSLDEGAGAMEEVAFSNYGKTARDYNVDEVRANVASWLAENNYADTSAALIADANNAVELMNLYMGGQA